MSYIIRNELYNQKSIIYLHIIKYTTIQTYLKTYKQLYRTHFLVCIFHFYENKKERMIYCYL